VTGYFGKVSTHGDFVTRRLPRELVEAWDGWLQRCIQASRAQLGAQWLDNYLTSPVWRFAIAPGVLGPEGLGGVMMPSVDRVGRYFPLMIGATGAPPLLDWMQRHGDWFDAIDDLARESLDAAFTLERFEDVPEPAPARAPSPVPAAGWRFPLDADPAAAIASAVLQGHSLWWSEGAPNIDASLLVCQGMPQPQAFAAMLNGSWKVSGWRLPDAITLS
jgi:type VI secretion system protein ImpM